MTAQLLLTGLLATTTAQAPTQAASPLRLAPGAHIIVTADEREVQGRLTQITADTIVVDQDHLPVRIPVTTVQQITRVGDSLFNGTAIGAALGGGAALGAMALACGNSGCADTSSSLDPRFTLLGTLIGAGVGALVDAAIERRKPVYRAGAGQSLAPTAVRSSVLGHIVLFGRGGFAGMYDDEGSLGSGGTIGLGVMVPIGTRFGVIAAYDRQTHRREFEPAGPPGATATPLFTGTEHLVTAKGVFFFRGDEKVRPYAGIGLAFLDSTRTSQSPTFVSQSGFFPTPGPPEVFNYHTQGTGLGFCAGVDVRVSRRLSILSDVALDIATSENLSSSRLTAGLGWRF